MPGAAVVMGGSSSLIGASDRLQNTNLAGSIPRPCDLHPRPESRESLQSQPQRRATMYRKRAVLALSALALAGAALAADKPATLKPLPEFPMQQRLARYAPVRLTADTSKLTPNERKMIQLLIEAAQQMDRVFWLEAWGEK